MVSAKVSVGFRPKKRRRFSPLRIGLCCYSGFDGGASGPTSSPPFSPPPATAFALPFVLSLGNDSASSPPLATLVPGFLPPGPGDALTEAYHTEWESPSAPDAALALTRVSPLLLT